MYNLITAEDCVTKAGNENDLALINVNYCNKVTCNVPRTNMEDTSLQRHTTGNQREDVRLHYLRVRLRTWPWPHRQVYTSINH